MLDSTFGGLEDSGLEEAFGEGRVRWVVGAPRQEYHEFGKHVSMPVQESWSTDEAVGVGGRGGSSHAAWTWVGGRWPMKPRQI